MRGAGRPIEVAISIDRLRGFSSPIDLVLLDPPAGVTAAPLQSPPEGDAAKQVTLVVTASALPVHQKQAGTKFQYMRQ